MIKKFSDYDSVQVYEGSQQIEVGGYELTIIGAKVEQYTNCEILKVAFDVVNHEKYAGFFSNKFKAAKTQDQNAKWPAGGIFDVFIPKDNGTEKDGYTKQAFKRFVTAVERSNDGYTWNWDENTLKGKTFGGVFGKEEFEGKNGSAWAVKCRFPRSVESIRSGDYTLPKDRPLKANNPITATPDVGSAYGDLSQFTEIGDGPVPF